MMNHKQRYSSSLGIRGRTSAVLVLALLIPLLLGGRVKTFASKEDDVRSYETYEWLPPRVMTRHGLLEDDELVAPVIRQAVNRELARKGYREVAEGGDLQVASGGFARSSSQLEGFLVHWGFDYYWGDWGATSVTPVTRQHREGTLVIVLLDPKTQKGVWGGLATALIGNPSLAGETLDKPLAKSINKAARSILKKLPKRKD